ncbi:MAG: hypothetical protein ACRC1U_05025, partial [Vibrionaceae bacterium]
PKQDEQSSSADKPRQITFAAEVYSEPVRHKDDLSAGSSSCKKLASAVVRPKTSVANAAVKTTFDDSERIIFQGDYDPDFTGKKRNKTLRAQDLSSVLPEHLVSPRMRGVLGVAKVSGLNIETKEEVVLDLPRDKRVEVYLPGPQDRHLIEKKAKSLSVPGNGFYVVKYFPSDAEGEDDYELVLVEKLLLENSKLKVTRLGYRHRYPVPKHERNPHIKGKQYYEKVLTMDEYRKRRNDPESTTCYELTGFSTRTGAKCKLSLNIGTPLTVHPADSHSISAVGDYCRQYGGGENDLVLMQVQQEGKPSKQELVLITQSQLSCYGFHYRVRPMQTPDPTPMKVKLSALTEQGKIEVVQLSTAEVYQARTATQESLSSEIISYCRRHNLSVRSLVWLSIPERNLLPDPEECEGAALLPAMREVLLSKEQLTVNLVRFVDAEAQIDELSAGVTSK